MSNYDAHYVLDFMQESGIKNESNLHLKAPEKHKKLCFSCQQQNAFFNFSNHLFCAFLKCKQKLSNNIKTAVSSCFSFSLNIKINFHLPVFSLTSFRSKVKIKISINNEISWKKASDKKTVRSIRSVARTNTCLFSQAKNHKQNKRAALKISEEDLM